MKKVFHGNQKIFVKFAKNEQQKDKKLKRYSIISLKLPVKAATIYLEIDARKNEGAITGKCE
jgi:hypothetical protein